MTFDLRLSDVPAQYLTPQGLLVEALSRFDAIAAKLDTMEEHMSRLDDAVTGLVSEVDTVVADLRARLEAAQADDAIAADVAADVEENVARLEAATAALRDEQGEPTDGGETPPA